MIELLITGGAALLAFYKKPAAGSTTSITTTTTKTATPTTKPAAAAPSSPSTISQIAAVVSSPLVSETLGSVADATGVSDIAADVGESAAVGAVAAAGGVAAAFYGIGRAIMGPDGTTVTINGKSYRMGDSEKKGGVDFWKSIYNNVVNYVNSKYWSMPDYGDFYNYFVDLANNKNKMNISPDLLIQWFHSELVGTDRPIPTVTFWLVKNGLASNPDGSKTTAGSIVNDIIKYMNDRNAANPYPSTQVVIEVNESESQIKAKIDAGTASVVEMLGYTAMQAFDFTPRTIHKTLGDSPYTADNVINWASVVDGAVYHFMEVPFSTLIYKKKMWVAVAN